MSPDPRFCALAFALPLLVAASSAQNPAPSAAPNPPAQQAAPGLSTRPRLGVHDVDGDQVGALEIPVDALRPGIAGQGLQTTH